MEKYDAHHWKAREYDIKTTLQCEEYKGSLVIQIRGNISGYDALKHLDPECDSISPVRNDCDFKEFEDPDGEGQYYFEMSLKNDQGDELLVKDTCDCFGDYIVGLEIIDCRNYKL